MGVKRVNAKRVSEEFPELFYRVRSHCRWGSVDLDAHAARIVLHIVEARKRYEGRAA